MRERPPLVLVPQYFGSTVFDRRNSRYLPFDRELTGLLLRLCETPFSTIAGEEPDPRRREALERFFDHFYSLGFFTTGLKFAGEALNVAPPPDHLLGPLAVHLEIVAACNLTCTHCFAGELPRREQPLTMAELDTLFGTLAQIGSFRLGLTGGEPLLRRDLFEIVDQATAHGLCPCLTTNGLLITEETAREFGRRNLVWLNVSLDGATADTNDRVRGAGTFDRVIANLRILGQHTRFTLAFTVMSTNVREVEACAELAARVGALTAVFRPLYPVGIALHHPELLPTFAQYSGALDRLAAMACDGQPELRSLDPFGPHSRWETQSVVHENYGCGAANLVCSISVSGDVNPCSFLGPEFAAANLRRQTFDEIWHNSRRFREIRALPSDGQGASTFGGGCRARSLVLAGSVNAPDPWTAGMPRHTRHPLAVLEVGVRRP
jgi:radical SAM protein with 4Fe4S-binding SPASM domain